MKSRFCLVVLAAMLAACGSTAVEPDPGELTERDVYPKGPYGTRQGSVIEALSFQALDGSTYGLGEVFADPANRVLLLSATAGWCQPCIDEQPKLAALHHEYSSRGLVVMAAMFEDRDHQVADVEAARLWQTDWELPYTLVADAPNAMQAFYPGSPPLNMVIDVDTMEILYLETGFDDNLIDTIIKSNLPQ